MDNEISIEINNKKLSWKKIVFLSIIFANKQYFTKVSIFVCVQYTEMILEFF